MKKAILLLMIVFCLGLVSAESGEYYYNEGSYYLSIGDVANARANFELAKSYLYGEELELVEENLEVLNSIESGYSEPLLLNEDNWYYLGEINDDVATQIYYDEYGNSAVHSRIDGEVYASELEDKLGQDLTYTSINGFEVYQSSTYTPLSGVNSYIYTWYCSSTDTTNILYVTYSGSSATIFDNDADLCPSSSYWVYILIGLAVAGLGYLGWKNYKAIKKYKKYFIIAGGIAIVLVIIYYLLFAVSFIVLR
jgi:hypothetical protein